MGLPRGRRRPEPRRYRDKALLTGRRGLVTHRLVVHRHPFHPLASHVLSAHVVSTHAGGSRSPGFDIEGDGDVTGLLENQRYRERLARRERRLDPDEHHVQPARL